MGTERLKTVDPIPTLYFQTKWQYNVTSPHLTWHSSLEMLESRKINRSSPPSIPLCYEFISCSWNGGIPNQTRLLGSQRTQCILKDKSDSTRKSISLKMNSVCILRKSMLDGLQLATNKSVSLNRGKKWVMERKEVHQVTHIIKWWFKFRVRRYLGGMKGPKSSPSLQSQGLARIRSLTSSFSTHAHAFFGSDLFL